MSDIGRPQTKSQSSRKGKKAWRKNVDIEDIEKGLENAREREISLGGQATNDDGELDFVIDTAGDEGILTKENAKLKRKVKGEDRSVKKLKSSEILVSKSKVPALNIERNNKRVSKSEVTRLMKLSGRVNEESKLLAKLESDGLFNATSVDLWDEDATSKSHKAILHAKYVQKGKSISEFSKASRAPKTLTEKPIALHSKETEESFVDAGKSYNPSLESWKNLIAKEFGTEKEKETKRQELIDFTNHIKDLIATLDDNEEPDSDDDDKQDQDEGENNKQEKADEQIEKNNNDTQANFKLSVNAPTKLKIKTKTKRNREQRHKQRMQLEAQLKELKHQINELSKVDEYTAEVTAKTQVNPSQKTKKNKAKLFKYDSLEKPLDVKLSHELTSNLKNLKPEGNLFYDQMRKLQQSGRVETRVPVAKKKKYTPKVTEKWTYKDFK